MGFDKVSSLYRIAFPALNFCIKLQLRKLLLELYFTSLKNILNKVHAVSRIQQSKQREPSAKPSVKISSNVTQRRFCLGPRGKK